VGHQSINQSINKFNGKNAQDKKGHKATCPLKNSIRAYAKVRGTVYLQRSNQMMSYTQKVH